MTRKAMENVSVVTCDNPHCEHRHVNLKTVIADTARQFERALETGDWTRALELHYFEAEIHKGGQRC